MLEVKYQDLPPKLVGRNQWLLWAKKDNGTPRGGKQPCLSSRPNYPGSYKEPSNWLSLERAREKLGIYAGKPGFEGIAGVGFGFIVESGFVQIDLDECYHGEQLDDWAKEIVGRFAGKTYIEISAGHGDGIHIVCEGTLPQGQPLKIATDESSPRLEVYNQHFLTLSGHKFRSSANDVENCQAIINQLIADYPYRYACNKIPTKTNWVPTESTDSIADDYGLDCLKIGYPSEPKETSNGLQGGHPFHGSTTGANYSVTADGKKWHCFRDKHNSGGDALILFAVKMGIIQCEDAGSGCLDDHWNEVFSELEKAGYKSKKVAKGFKIPTWQEQKVSLGDAILKKVWGV